MALKTKTISVQIPEGAEPGDTLELEVHGQSLELVVPVGSQAGDVLEIQVATGDEERETQDEDGGVDDGGDDDGDVTKVDIGGGRILEFASRLPADHVDGAAAGENIETEVVDESDGTYALPWRSGIEMAQHWQTIQEALSKLQIQPRRRILELGSGLGLVGISFATVLTQEDSSNKNTSELRRILANDAQIILSDLPAAMPLLNFNVGQNQAPQKIILTTRALRWTMERPEDDCDPFSKEPPFDCVLGSDLLYNVEYIPHLVATLKRLLHPTRGIVLLAVRWRKPELERAFFQDSGLDWQVLPLPSTKCSLTWEDFGDPTKEASNKYFYQTLISVDGKPQALADIAEDQAKDLPPEEFQAWEQSFVQMYLGRPKKEPTTEANLSGE